MNKVRRFTVAQRVLFGAVFAVWGLGTSARGQTQPNVKISDPTSNSSVTVGAGSTKLGVHFKVDNGYYPTSAKLIYTDATGSLVNFDTTTTFEYDGTTGVWTALLTVPSGTTSNVTISVRATLPVSSGNPTAKTADDQVTGITTTKQQ